MLLVQHQVVRGPVRTKKVASMLCWYSAKLSLLGCLVGCLVCAQFSPDCFVASCFCCCVPCVLVSCVVLVVVYDTCMQSHPGLGCFPVACTVLSGQECPSPSRNLPCPCCPTGRNKAFFVPSPQVFPSDFPWVFHFFWESWLQVARSTLPPRPVPPPTPPGAPPPPLPEHAQARSELELWSVALALPVQDTGKMSPKRRSQKRRADRGGPQGCGVFVS